MSEQEHINTLSDTDLSLDDARNIIVTRVVSKEPSVSCHGRRETLRPPSFHVRMPILISQSRGAPRTGATARDDGPTRARHASAEDATCSPSLRGFRPWSSQL